MLLDWCTFPFIAILRKLRLGYIINKKVREFVARGLENVEEKKVGQIIQMLQKRL